MPHREMSRIRTTSIYSDLIDHIRQTKSLELEVMEKRIKAEFLKRDFSKRQQNLIIFLYTLSYPYGKGEAYVPKMQDFELGGVSKTSVKKELGELMKLKVIKQGSTEKHYAFVDPSEWEADYHSGYSDTRAQELFLYNLSDAGIDPGPVKEKIAKLRL